MSARIRSRCCPALVAALLWGVPLAAAAQSAPASSASSAPMDMGAMPDMDHGTVHRHHDMSHDMSPDTTPMKPTPAMTMGAMQGGSAPPDARSPDYSDGLGKGTAHRAMGMDDNASVGMLLLDQLEATHNGQRWGAQGWYGNPGDKLWLRTEGERSDGALEGGDVEAFWSHAVTSYWDTRLGVRHDLGGPPRSWAAFGIQGLAPYWLEIELMGYIGPAGRTAARFRAEYEWLFTQRLILQPELELNAYGKPDTARHLGSGLSDATLGLRLRYEIRRRLAPYIGVVWIRRFGGTVDVARDAGQGSVERQWVAGVRLWF